MKVLIADDDPVSLRVLEAAVDAAGHSWASAHDGDEAWRLYQRFAPDVVISDWLMPGMDGPTLCRRIRESGAGPYSYVVLLTALGGQGHALAGMRAGADDYLTKPLDRDELELRLIAAERMTGLHRRLNQQQTELERLNADLYEEARNDPLLLIGNRRRLLEDLELLAGRVKRYGHSYSLALCDIDRFKAYNDRFGHPAGDQVLRQVSAALVETGRSGDAVYRYGGEELLVVLPEQDLGSAARAAERMRLSVEELAIAHPGNAPAGVVTISLGVANVDPEQIRSASVALDLADAALYRAKEAGRNRVVVDGQAGQVGQVAGNGRPVRVIVADDDSVVRRALTGLVESESSLELVGEAVDTESAVELAARSAPDVAVLDLIMPGGGGAVAAARILKRSPSTRIVAMTSDDSPQTMLDMQRSGAVGFLVKGVPRETVVETIHSCASF